MPNKTPIQVETSAVFRRNLRKLAKKYRTIKKDIQPIIEALSQGKLPGDQIPGVNYPVFKLRVRNTDVQKGKSGGYRLIYYLKTDTGIILLTLYTKSERANITPEDIRQIIEDSSN